MRRTSLASIGVLAAGMFAACIAGAATAQPAAPQAAPQQPAAPQAAAPQPAAAPSGGPPAGYQINAEYTEKSPDGAITIEQYFKDDPDNGYAWQFWVRRGGTLSLLDKQDDYPAGFRFTNNSQWLIRMQKTGAGYADIYLYRLGPSGFAPATKKPLSDLAWAYFYGRPEARKIEKPNLHIFAGLVKGVDDDYKSLGETWPANRYLVIGLSGDLDPNAHHGQILQVHGWRTRYDLQTGKFDVPADFAAGNKKALVPQDLSK
jgi:hypothetical protein